MAYWMAGHAFLAESQTGPVGTFYIQENRAGGGAHYCNCGFATDPAATGQGVARQMLDYALQTATSLGFEGMVFNFVVSSNTRAVALWQKNGFEIVGTVPDAFRVHGSQDADALVMFRAL
ncbi:MAG: N-acetyltransferase family protein [Paracoccaceae bacterium]